MPIVATCQRVCEQCLFKEDSCSKTSQSATALFIFPNPSDELKLGQPYIVGLCNTPSTSWEFSLKALLLTHLKPAMGVYCKAWVWTHAMSHCLLRVRLPTQSWPANTAQNLPAPPLARALPMIYMSYLSCSEGAIGAIALPNWMQWGLDEQCSWE